MLLHDRWGNWAGSWFTAKSVLGANGPSSRERVRRQPFRSSVQSTLRGFGLSALESNKISVMVWFQHPWLTIHARMLAGVLFLVASTWKQLIRLTGNWLTDYNKTLWSVQFSWPKTPTMWWEEMLLRGSAISGQGLEPDRPPPRWIAGWVTSKSLCLSFFLGNMG